MATEDLLILRWIPTSAVVAFLRFSAVYKWHDLLFKSEDLEVFGRGGFLRLVPGVCALDSSLKLGLRHPCSRPVAHGPRWGIALSFNAFSNTAVKSYLFIITRL